MKYLPILMNGDMVRAVLAGFKTQTRRIMKPQPVESDPPLVTVGTNHEPELTSKYSGCMYPGPTQFGVYSDHQCWKSPFGKPGDHLWVRENLTWDSQTNALAYQADGQRVPIKQIPLDAKPVTRKVLPSIFMPKWAARITLEVLNVKVERLKDISGPDAKAEGMEIFDDPDVLNCKKEGSILSFRYVFENYWCQMAGDILDGAPWEANPWVWVYEFKVLTPAIAVPPSLCVSVVQKAGAA